MIISEANNYKSIIANEQTSLVCKSILLKEFSGKYLKKNEEVGADVQQRRAVY